MMTCFAAALSPLSACVHVTYAPRSTHTISNAITYPDLHYDNVLVLENDTVSGLLDFEVRGAGHSRVQVAFE